MKSPTIPKAIRLPIAPAKINRIGRSALLLIRNGRMILSEAPTIIHNTKSTEPQTGSPEAYFQMTAGNN